MKLVVISDTHGFHRDVLNVPDGDVLIHCGDVSNVGEREQVEDFVRWFGELPHANKIFIAGNHDRCFDPKFNRNNANEKPEWLQRLLKTLPAKNVHYLENSGVIIDGVKFWGSPITPDFYPENWAFNAKRGDTIRRYWNGIPSDTDVLITHGPPEFKLDWVVSGQFVGCGDLRYQIEAIKPVYHFFGHIHESYGVEETIDTTFANASLLNQRYSLVNEPLEFDFNK